MTSLPLTYWKTGRSAHLDGIQYVYICPAAEITAIKLPNQHFWITTDLGQPGITVLVDDRRHKVKVFRKSGSLKNPAGPEYACQLNDPAVASHVKRAIRDQVTAALAPYLNAAAVSSATATSPT